MRQILLAFLLSITSATAALANNGIVSKSSRYSVPETIARLETVLKGKGITIFARIDHAGEAEKAGLKMRPSQLLIFGNPKAGTPIMNAAPLAALDLPLKALAWQDAEGKIWLSYNDPATLKERFKLSDDLMKPMMGISGLMDAALK